MPTQAREREIRAVYEEWCQGRLTQVAAAARLGIGERTFRRYVARLRAHGSPWSRDRSCPRPPSRRAPDEERASLERLYLEQYSGWNVQHFYDKYRNEHGGTRSYTWVKDCLQAAGLCEKRAPNRVLKRRRERNGREPASRSPREGMLLHQIASRHEWVSGHTWELMLIADDATGKVHRGFFVEERGIWSMLAGIQSILRRGLFDCYGLSLEIPKRLRAQETAFAGRTRPQLYRVMSELGIEVVRPERPARMRNARMVATLHNRLPQELAREGIADIGRANGYLKRFWVGFNEVFTVKPRELSDAFIALEPDFLATEIERIFCLKHQARVCVRNRLHCEGKELDVPRLGGPPLCSGEQYRIHEYEDGRCVLFNQQYKRVAALNVNGVG